LLEAILETRKGVPTNWAGTPDTPSFRASKARCQDPFCGNPRQKERQTAAQLPPPLVNSEDGSTLTPGPMVEEIATRQIPVEICLTSNLRTGCCPSIAQHPVRDYFDRGVMVTLNSDDPAMFNTSLTCEYQLAQDTFGFTNEHIRELARNSFEASFLPAEKKLEFLNLFDAISSRS